jgi:hypothetical protein
MPEPTERRREDEPVRGRTATVPPAGRPAEETYRLEVRLTDYEPGVPGLAVRWVPEPPPEPALGQVVEMVFEQHVSNEDLPQGVVPLEPARAPEPTWTPTPPRKPPPPGQRPFTGFDRERAEYERRKPNLLKTMPGEFVVLVGEELAGPVATYEAAIREGYRRFGRGPLYVKQVLEVDPVAEVTRAVAPCRS